MQRPVMDPTFVKDVVKAKKKGLPYWNWVAKSAKWFGRSLLSNPLVVRRPDDPWKPSFFKLFVRMIVTWSIFAPVLVGMTAFILVWLGTHPSVPLTVADPNSQGCYFDTVNFASADGTPLMAWELPVVDAKRVLEERDQVLKIRRPAIILVHDFGQSPQQMLPVVKPLHDEGMLVMVLALRGTGTGSPAGQTFGIDEAKDIAAAVELLRHNPFVDPTRIGVAGIGTGANAALIAAAQDPSIKSVIVANPVKNCDEEVSRRIVPRKPWLKWMEPLCRQVFNLVYHTSLADVNYDKLAAVRNTRPTLLFDTGDNYILHEGTTAKQMKMFCRRYLRTRDLPALGAAQ